MKKITLFISLWVFFALTAFADLPFRNHRYDAFKVLPITQNDIVFIGNSITNMNEWWETFSSNHNVKNRGVSGAITDEALANIEAVAVGKPAKVFFMLGTNDLGTAGINNTEHVLNNMILMVDRLQKVSPNTQIYIQSILPSTVGLRTLEIQQATNEALKELCQEKGLTYIDLWDDLLSLTTSSTHTLDNLHLKASGYQIWAEKIEEYVGSDCAYPSDCVDVQNNGGISGSYGMRATTFSTLPVNEGDILIIGDEMIHGGEWHELLQSGKVKSRGTGWGYPGPSLDITLQEIPLILNSRSGSCLPSKVLLYAGVADVNGSTALSTLQTTYQNIINKIKELAPSTQIYLMSLQPTATANINTNRVVPFNEILQTIAAGDAQVEYVDIYSDFVSNNVGNSAYFSGNYLYGMGYVKVAQKIAAAMGDASVVAITDEEAAANYRTFELRTVLGNAIVTAAGLKAGEGVGEYPAESLVALTSIVDDAYEMLMNGGTQDEYESMAAQVSAAVNSALSSVNMPKASNSEKSYYYYMSTPLRENRYPTSYGANADIVGQTTKSDAAMWKFVLRDDGTYNIVNYSDKTYVSPASNNDTALRTQTAVPATGWEFKPAATPGYFIIVNGTAQFNQTNNNTLGYKVYNWGGGANTNDSGCQYLIAEAKVVEGEDEDIAEPSNIPFVPTAVVDGELAKSRLWYLMRITETGLLIYDNAGAEYVSLGRVLSTYEDKDLWCFAGDDANGYAIYNKNAGAGKVLASSKNMTTTAGFGGTGGSTYPTMQDENSLPTDYIGSWDFEPSDKIANVDGWFMRLHGTSFAVNNFAGSERNRLAFWAEGTDANSTLQFEIAEADVEVLASQGVLTSTTAGSSWCSKWESNFFKGFVLTTSANNITVKNDCLAGYSGTAYSSTYTLTAPEGYVITEYSFDYVNSDTGSHTINLNIDGQNYASSSSVQHLDVKVADPARVVTFVQSDERLNKGITFSNFVVVMQPATEEPEPSFEVFRTATSGDIPYRIPAIAMAKNGDIIAVADYRHSRQDIGIASYGRIDLHSRISKDNGASWEPIDYIVEGQGSNVGSDLMYVGFGDPCIVADRESNRVLVLSCAGNVSFPSGTRSNHQNIARFYSDDNGANWSAPEDIAESIYSQFDASVNHGPVRAMFIGSGKIHQSRYVKVNNYYRLYCAVLLKNKNNVNTNFVLYSDDFGGNWSVLGGVENAPIPSGADEPKVEELPNGNIVISSRMNGGRYFNIYTFTDALAAQGSWGTMATSNSSVGGVVALNNSCNGEIMMVPVVRNEDKAEMWLALQSLPFGSARSNVGIYYKELATEADYNTPANFAKEWDGRHQASFLPSAYSTMCFQKDSTIAFLYEEDTYGVNAYGGYNIMYKNYSIEQITDSAYSVLKGREPNVAPEGPSDATLALIEEAEEWLEYIGVGYPVESERATLLAAIEAAKVNPTASEGSKLEVVLDNYLGTSNVVTPVGGKMYSFTMEAKNGNKFYLNYNGSDIQMVARGEGELPETAKFICEQNDNGSVTLSTSDGKYLVYHSKYAGVNWLQGNGSTTGLQTEKDAMAEITFEKIIPSSFVAGTIQQMFGYLAWKSIRGYRTDNGNAEWGYMVLKTDGSDYDGANGPFWNDGYSSAFRVEEYDIPEGIEEILDTTDRNEGIYDLTGRKLERISGRGVYIVNGKKVLVK